jgi:hypothetical protein
MSAFIKIIFCVLLLTVYKNSICQPYKHYFFEFHQDSLRNRTINAAAPAALQTFSLNNSLITDYIGNTRVSLITGFISGKNDTMLALHSLAGGAGNLTLEGEWPFLMRLIRGQKRRDFIGLSLHPRVSTIVNNTQTFETSMVSYDMGFNITGRLSGDLGNLSMKFTIRNALCTGNQPFVKRTFGLQEKQFFYNSVQLRLRAGPNIFSFTLPTLITDFHGEEISGLPVYVGYALMF